ncbi:MAG: archease [Nanoarchaeota archaeon]
MKKYELLEHTSELKLKIYGKRLEEIFENCALAFSDIISRGKKVKKNKIKEIEISGKDFESLMYNFIEELIYLLDAENLIVSSAKVKVDKNKLNADIYCDSADNYKNLDYIKSATYAEMYIRQKKDKTWEAQVVVDV